MDTSTLISQALEILPVAVVVLDRDHKILLVNRRTETLLRVNPGSRGRPIADALPHALAAAIDGMISEIASSDFVPERTIGAGAITGIAPPLAVALTPLTVGDGWVCAIRELPAVKEANASAAQITSKMGHDLKTPLTSIKAYTEALTDLSSDSQVRQFLKVIDEETDRLVAMINALIKR